MRPHDPFWPRHVPRSIHVPATSLWDNLAVSARRYPEKPALQYLGTAWTYRQLEQACEHLAGYLRQLGVERGDRVIVCMQNTPQLAIAHYAIYRLQAVVVPVNPMNKAQELEHYIDDAGVRVALTTADLAPELVAASGQLPAARQLQHLIVSAFTDTFDPDGARDLLPAAWKDWLLTERPLPQAQGLQVHAWREAMACRAALPPASGTAQDLAALPYTSGTTGLPKGCRHLHRSLMHNAIATALWGNVTPESVLLGVVPMFHITGMVAVLHSGIYGGCTVVLMPRWDRELAAHLIARHQVTHWTNIPTMVIDLLGSPNVAQFDLGSLRYIGGGGAAMPQAVAQRLYDQYGLRYAEGYGLTETAAPSHSNPVDRPKQQCLGIPFIGTDARIIDPDTLQELPPGAQGEIVIHGPEVFDGYWNHPEATQAAFVTLGDKPYFRTGDLGQMDEEGYFFITDRLKRMINASGFKVWPAEVEALMFRHPAVQEACIIGTRDAYRGESVKAVIVKRLGHEAVTAEDIIAWCREHMAAYKVPRAVSFVDALPKSGSGKVMWRLLQEQERQPMAESS